MILEAWALQWAIHPAALRDLRARMGAGERPDAGAGAEGSESRMQSLVRLDAARRGVSLTRNNVGVLPDLRGVPIRYGLWNESRAQNQAVKSADLIGIKPILIGPQHVGSIIGQFVAREVKNEGWKWKGDAHECAQLSFAHFIVSKGGDAGFTTGSFDTVSPVR